MRTVWRLLLLAAVVAVTPQTGVAQRVGLEVTLSADTLVDGRTLRLPTIKLTNLLNDARWGNALRTSMRLLLRFELEVWRSRDGWIDQFERGLAFDVLIRHEALFDHYTVTQRQAGGAREQVLPTWEALEQYLAGGYKLIVRPATTGTYYYVAKVVITTFSESDIHELERFVQGRAAGEPERRGEGGVGLMRFLLRMTGGLPQQMLEARSGRVIVR